MKPRRDSNGVSGMRVRAGAIQLHAPPLLALGWALKAVAERAGAESDIQDSDIQDQNDDEVHNVKASERHRERSGHVFFFCEDGDMSARSC